jgi:hypothetical protein
LLAHSSIIAKTGVLNFGIYIRPRMMKFRKDNPELGFWVSLWKVKLE